MYVCEQLAQGCYPKAEVETHNIMSRESNAFAITHISNIACLNFTKFSV